MVACFAFGGGAGLVIIGNMASIVTSFGFETTSAIAVSVLALGNGIGRVIYGKLSDTFGRKAVITFAFAFQAVLIFVLSTIDTTTTTKVDGLSRFTGPETVSAALLFVLIWFIGANYGCVLAVFPALTKDNYGLKNFGANYETRLSGVGHRRLRRFADRRLPDRRSQGGRGQPDIYLWAMYEVVALLIVGVGLMLLMKPPAKKMVEEPAAPVAAS